MWCHIKVCISDQPNIPEAVVTVSAVERNFVSASLLNIFVTVSFVVTVSVSVLEQNCFSVSLLNDVVTVQYQLLNVIVSVSVC